MGITIRELVTKLSVDGDKATGKLAAFGLAVNGITAALDIMVRGFDFAKQVTVGFVTDMAVQADSLDKVAASTGQTTQALQEMSFIAEQTGVPMTNLIKGTQNLARNLRDAALAGAGKGSFNIAIKEVGLTLEELAGLDFPETLAVMGDALQKIEEPARRVALAQKLLGEEAGPKMAALLAQGGDGVRKLQADFKALGGATSDLTIQAGVDLVGAIDNVKTFFNLLKLEVLELAPEITELVEEFLEWLKANRAMLKIKLIAFFRKVITEVKKLVKASKDWLKLFTEIVTITLKLAGVLVKLIDKLGGVEGAAITATTALLAFRAAQLAATNPVLALGIGIAAAAVALNEYAKSAFDAEEAQRFFDKGVKQSKFISPENIKKASTSLAGNIFNNKKLGPKVLADLAQLSTKDLDKIFGDVDRSITADAERGGGVGEIRGGSGIDPFLLRGRLALLRQNVKERRKNARVLEERVAARDKGNRQVNASIRARRRRLIAKERLDADRKRGEESRGGAGGKDDTSAFTQSELLKLIQKASETGQSLTGLIGKRKIPGGVPPVISVFAPVINQTNNTTLNVEGGDGIDPGELEDRIIESLAAERQKELREAIEAIQPAAAV